MSRLTDFERRLVASLADEKDEQHGAIEAAVEPKKKIDWDAFTRQSIANDAALYLKITDRRPTTDQSEKIMRAQAEVIRATLNGWGK